MSKGVPTHSIEMEQALLGGIMLNPGALPQIAMLLTPMSFFDPFHRDLAQHMWGMAERGQAIKPTAIALNYGDQEVAPGVSVRQYLGKLARDATMDTLDAAVVVADLKARRDLIAAIDEAKDRLSSMPVYQPLADVIDVVEAAVYGVRESNRSTELKPLWQLAEEVAQSAIRMKETGVVEGMSWGLSTLDNMLGVLMPGDTVGIAASSGAGKSALALQLLMANAVPITDGARVAPHLMISMEMTGADLAMRAISRLGGPTFQAQRTGKFNEAGIDRIEAAAADAKNFPIMLDARGRLPLREIRTMVRHAKRRYGIRSFVVDHLQLVLPEKDQAEIEAVQDVARTMKDISKENDVVGIWLAQLTRASQKEMRTWRFSSNAIWGGDHFKQGCDILVGLANPALYLIDNEPAYEAREEAKAKHATDIEKWRNAMEAGVLKRRSGDRGPWKRVGWNGDTQTFFDE